MTAHRAPLRVGTILRHDGETVTITELHADTVTLRTARGAVSVLSVRDLLSEATTQVVTDSPECPQPDLAGAGVLLSDLTKREQDTLRFRLAHVQEVLTGYQEGHAELARPGEPRADFEPSRSLIARYEVKAQELGIGQRTLRRWVHDFSALGPVGLVDGRAVRGQAVLTRLDQSWVDMCRAVLDENITNSSLTKQAILDTVEARLGRDHEAGTVRIPDRSTAYQALSEMTRGRNTFTGSAKGRRSIAERPQGTYGSLRATRPGEYLLLDTTPLDVFAMERVTNRWVGVQLTAAMDLYTRSITGFRLSAVSAQSVDVASVLYDSIVPRPVPDSWPSGAAWPYPGVPTTVVVNAEQWESSLTPLPVQRRLAASPVVAVETIVIDHGKIYVSDHVQSVCDTFGISIQPVRLAQGSDKGPLERWFRTLRQSLLERLPGYKGPDVYSRGKDVEKEAFFFIHELDAIIREWVAVSYHQRPHAGLIVPEVPGLDMSPYQMYELGVARSGFIDIPTRTVDVHDFLPVVWRTIQHYGLSFLSLRYNGDGLNRYRDTTSPYTGAHRGKWPFRYDPHDVSCVWFQDPADGTWHRLMWEYAADVNGPFSADALLYARELAATTQRFPDTRLALIRLLDRVNMSVALTPDERKVALKRAREDRAQLGVDVPVDPLHRLTSMPAGVEFDPPNNNNDADDGVDVALVTVEREPVESDDDTDDEVDGTGPDEKSGMTDDEYYADAFQVTS